MGVQWAAGRGGIVGDRPVVVVVLRQQRDDLDRRYCCPRVVPLSQPRVDRNAGVVVVAGVYISLPCKVLAGQRGEDRV